MPEQNYGKLIHQDIKLYRKWFIEMASLHGTGCIYKAPRADKQYDLHGELETRYYEPETVYVMFEEAPTAETTKKLGWKVENGHAIVHVPYDLAHLEDGALFELPSPFDNTEGRVFRVIKMTTPNFIYPAAITCELAPEFKNAFDKSQLSHTQDNFNLLADAEGDTY